MERAQGQAVAKWVVATQVRMLRNGPARLGTMPFAPLYPEVLGEAAA